MITRATFYWKQRRIQRWKDQISRAHTIAEKEARAKGATNEELHELPYEFIFQHRLANDEMIRLTSNYYEGQANRMVIPVPEFKIEGGAWMESEECPGRYHLTHEALHGLRSAIRLEKEGILWFCVLAGDVCCGRMKKHSLITKTLMSYFYLGVTP